MLKSCTITTVVLATTAIFCGSAVAGSSNSLSITKDTVSQRIDQIHFVGEELCRPLITQNNADLFDLPQSASTRDDTTDPLASLRESPAKAPVAIAPLPPAFFTGAGMLLGGALLKIVRKIRMS